MFDQPEIGQRRINIFGSLKKATDFNAQYLNVDFEFEFPSTKIQYDPNKTQLKYTTNCSYYMKTNNIKTHNFGNVFELQITQNISKSSYLNENNKLSTIYFEVNSVDNWNRHRIEGYGTFNINLDGHNCDNNNINNICVPIWRPIGSIHDEMKRYFIGGGQRLKDKKLISLPKIDDNNDNKFNSRINWNTVHSGYLHLNINILSINNQNQVIHKIDKIDKGDKELSFKSRPHHDNKRKKRRSKLSKLITIEQVEQNEQTEQTQKVSDRHNKRRKKSSLLQKLELK